MTFLYRNPEDILELIQFRENSYEKSVGGSITHDRRTVDIILPAISFVPPSSFLPRHTSRYLFPPPSPRQPSRHTYLSSPIFSRHFCPDDEFHVFLEPKSSSSSIVNYSYVSSRRRNRRPGRSLTDGSLERERGYIDSSK